MFDLFVCVLFQVLATCNEWYVDGTFKIAPILFQQVFVIMGFANGGVHPCLYALLPNKNQSTYSRLLVEINNIVPNLNPRSVSVDFEIAIHNAFRNQFNGIEIHGCFFHLLQNLKKHIAAVGLMA